MDGATDTLAERSLELEARALGGSHTGGLDGTALGKPGHVGSLPCRGRLESSRGVASFQPGGLRRQRDRLCSAPAKPEKPEPVAPAQPPLVARRHAGLATA